MKKPKQVITGFVRVTRGLSGRLRGAGVSVPHQAVLLEMLTYWDQESGAMFPSVATLASGCRVSERSIQRSFKLFERCGLLTRDDRVWLTVRWFVTDKLRALLFPSDLTPALTVHARTGVLQGPADLVAAAQGIHLKYWGFEGHDLAKMKRAAEEAVVVEFPMDLLVGEEKAVRQRLALAAYEGRSLPDEWKAFMAELTAARLQLHLDRGSRP